MVFLAPRVNVSKNAGVIFAGNLTEMGRLVPYRMTPGYICRDGFVWRTFLHSCLCSSCEECLGVAELAKKPTSAVRSVATPADLLKCFRIKPLASDNYLFILFVPLFTLCLLTKYQGGGIARQSPPQDSTHQITPCMWHLLSGSRRCFFVLFFLPAE